MHTAVSDTGMASTTLAAYRVERFPKIEGQYHRIGADQVQIGPYRMARIDHEDAQAIYVRVYAPVTVSPPPAQVAVVPNSSLDASSHYRLRPFDHGLPRDSQWRNELAIADMDRDGQLDIVSTPARKSLSWPVVFRGDGAGNWQRWTPARYPDIGYDYGAVAVADVDRNGLPDLALAMHLRGFTVLRQTATALFERADAGLPLIEQVQQHGVSGVQLALTHSAAGQPWMLLIDERLRPSDRVGSRPALHLYEFREQGWHRLTDLPAEVGAARSLKLLHADRSTPGIWLLLQDINGHKQIAQLLEGHWQLHALGGVPVDCQLRSAAVAELDGDGRADFVVSCQRVIGETWWSQVELQRSTLGALTLHAGDHSATIANLHFVNRTREARQADLAMLGQDGTLHMLAADQHGGYTRETSESVPEWRHGCRGQALESADLDRDGSEEIIASFAGEPSAFEPGPGCRGGGGISVWKLLPAS